jgi:hypothetical protein
MALQCPARLLRLVVLPEELTQPVHGHHPTGVEQQDREQAPHLAPGHGVHLAGGLDLHGPKEPEEHPSR